MVVLVFSGNDAAVWAGCDIAVFILAPLHHQSTQTLFAGIRTSPCISQLGNQQSVTQFCKVGQTITNLQNFLYNDAVSICSNQCQSKTVGGCNSVYSEWVNTLAPKLYAFAKTFLKVKMMVRSVIRRTFLKVKEMVVYSRRGIPHEIMEFT